MYISFPEVNVSVQGVEKVILPSMVMLRQIYDKYCIKDPATSLRESLLAVAGGTEKWNGIRIAITVGSRGIPSRKS